MSQNIVPVATMHPSLTNATWVIVSAVPWRDRTFLRLVNEDPAVDVRFEIATAIPTLATEGTLLYANGGFVEEDTFVTQGNVYAYQASGGAIITLAVTEGM